MCERYTLHESWAEIYNLYRLTVKADTHRNVPPRYNIAPSQDVLIVRPEDGTQRVAEVSWGLVPVWARAGFKTKPINARGETVNKKMFKPAFLNGRCLIPADGYYEWVKINDGTQPYYLHMQGGKPFSFAGIWSRNDNLEVESCVIITWSPSDNIKHIHDRMPVILPEASYDEWLDLETDPDKAHRLLGNNEGKRLQYHLVNDYVSNFRNQGTECIAPA